MGMVSTRQSSCVAKTGLLCLFAAISVSLQAPRSVAGADTMPSIAFADSGALTLATDAVRAQLVNNTATAWQLTATAYLDIVDDSVATREVPVSVPSSVPPGASVIVEVGPSPEGVTTATGFVVVTGTRDGDVALARRALIVGPSTLTPRIEKWTASNQSWTASGAAHGIPPLPLSGPACGALGVDSKEVTLTSGSDFATLSYQCIPPSVEPSALASVEPSGDAVLVFREEEVPGVGQYSGTLMVGDTSVALTYVVAESILWAILVITIGLLLAVWRQVHSSGGPIRRADNRVTLIGEDAVLRQAEFEERAASASYRVYDIKLGVAQDVGRLRSALASQRPSLTSKKGLQAAFGTKDPDELNAVLKDAAALEQTVQHWPEVAKDLKALAEAVQGLDNAHGAAGIPRPSEFSPLLVQRARELLMSAGGSPRTKPLTLHEARELSDEVPKLTSALKLLPIVAGLYVHLELGGVPSDLDPSDRDVWFRARRLVRQARAEFAVAADVVTLEQAKVDELVGQARALHRRVAPPPAPGEDLPDVMVDRREELAPQFPIPIIGGIGRLLGGAWAQLSTRPVDLVWLVVAIAIAVWSGLALYWIDKPWGRPSDVIVLLVWAFGTTTLLTPIFSALEDVAARPTPLTKPDDKSGA